MKTIQDYQKRHNHIKQYCENMIYKKELILQEFPDNIKETAERNAYRDILFKLTYDKTT